MAASGSVHLHPSKFNPLSLPASHSAALHYLPPLNPTLKFTKSPLSTNCINFSGSAASSHWHRRLPLVTASSGKSSEISTQSSRFSQKGMGSIHQQLLHPLSFGKMILEIMTLIWRLPGFIARFFKKEEKFIDTVEEDIIKTADVIKVGTKVVEKVAEGLEEVAERIEKAAKTVDKDAKKVDDIMDKVKEKTKVVHDELEEVVGILDGSMHGMDKVSAEVKNKLKDSKELKETEKDINDDPSMAKSPPSLAKIINTSNLSVNNSHYKPFEDPILLWTPQSLIHRLLDSLQWPLFHVQFESLFHLMPLRKVSLGTMLMVSFLFFIGAMSNTHLANHAF